MSANVKIVTVYAFSLDNFNRDEEEVEYLMNLLIEKFEDFKNQNSIVMEKKIKIRIVGDIKKFPTDVQEIISEIESMTNHHSELLLNICFGYSSTWEIQEAMNHTREYPELFPQYLQISTPDCLVRTSGENRLSDFLLYQCAQGTQLMFIKKCWPELTAFDFIKIILKYSK